MLLTARNLAAWSAVRSCLLLLGLLFSVPSALAQTGGFGDLVVTELSEATGTATELVPSPDPSVVDIVVFFGQELLERGRSLSDLDATANTMVSFTNEAYARSGIPLTLRIVYAGLFPERLAGLGMDSAFQVLGEMSGELREGLMADYGADAVVLIKAAEDADMLFGLAIIGSESSLSNPESVPRTVLCLGAAPNGGLECFGAGGIFAHEVGHLFGAGHQRFSPDSGSIGAFEFSFASECGGGTLVYTPVTGTVQVYSTPNFSFNGEPCGVAASEGPDGVDNAYTIDLTRALMAQLRPTMPVDGTVSVEGPVAWTVAEGDTPLTIPLRRTGDIAEAARVELAVVSRVSANADVIIDPVQVLFGPGQDAATVQVSVVDDAAAEPTEEVVIGLRNPWRVDLATTSVAVTITDNDVPAPPLPPPPPRSGGGSIGFVWLLMTGAWLARRRSRRQMQ